MIVQFIMAVVLTEAAAELLTESRLTARLRGLPGALGYFFGCGYCASVWIGVGAAYLLRLEGVLEGLGAAEPLLWGVAVHRGSNVLHEGVARFLGRVPLALWLTSHVRHEGAVPVDVQLPAEGSAQGPAQDEDTEEIRVEVPIKLEMDGEVLAESLAEAAASRLRAEGDGEGAGVGTD